MDWFDRVESEWHLLVATGSILLSVAASLHAVMHKRDSRATVLWVGCIWLSPLFGPALYLLLGVNRIKRRARSLRSDLQRYDSRPWVAPFHADDLREHLPNHAIHLERLARAVGRVAKRRLLPGNRVEPLLNGDETYPAMLAAIDGATHSISLATYIFDNDPAGRKFADALERAVRRGVEVRVLIDDAGARYSWPSILRVLRRRGVRVVRFMPRFILLRLAALNMRSHRKILVVDGRIGFTGGINIRHGNCLQAQPRKPVQDLHFRLQGPVVAQLQEAFVDDWLYCTGEALRDARWFPPLEPAGSVIARGITDGPDEDFEKLPWTILSALSCAHFQVQILTPYFLPNQAMISALNAAALRGVRVDIYLPSQNNLPFMHWASAAHWWQLLEWGCRIWLTPPPFDHSKVILVDDCWSFIGSANQDPRSLRLNFEFNVECYDEDLAHTLAQIVKHKRQHARLVTLKEVDARPFAIRLRDGIARLFTPFL